MQECRRKLTSENTNSRKKTKYACVVEAHETLLFTRNHEDHIGAKGFNSTHYDLVRKLIPIPKAMKTKAAVNKRMGEARKVASVAIEESEGQKRRSFWKHREKK